MRLFQQNEFFGIAKFVTLNFIEINARTYLFAIIIGTIPLN